jgi:hypothetical protein
MPRPLPVPIRQAIWQRLQAGQDGPAIAAALDLEPRTVRRLIARFRQTGPSAVDPSYDRCGAATPKPAESLVQAALGLRRQHPTWGAGLIHLMLRRQLPDGALPAVRTLQRWFRGAERLPAPVGRRPAAGSHRAQRPHEVWQMDAAELVKLRSGQLVSWLRIADECSGAVLRTAVFPPGSLDSGRADADPGATAAGVRPLGPARAVAGGQRGAVGHAGRPADGPGVVVARCGGGRGPQSTGAPSRQWGGRAVAGDGQAVGRALDLRQPGGVATTLGGPRRDPAAGVSEHRRPESVGGFPGAGSLRAGVYVGVGGGPVEPGAGRGGIVRLRGASASRCDRHDFVAQQALLYW